MRVSLHSELVVLFNPHIVPPTKHGKSLTATVHTRRDRVRAHRSLQPSDRYRVADAGPARRVRMNT